MSSDNWKEVQLQDVVTKLGDGLHGTPKYDSTGDYYFINGNNIGNGKIILKKSTKRVNKTEYEKYKKELNDRTILVSINGTLGNVGTYENEKCILGKSACYFNVDLETSKDFVKYVVSNKHFQDYIKIYANGSTIKNVSLKTMREYPFLLPPLSEQEAIAEILCGLDDKINLLLKQNETLEGMAEVLFRQWFMEEADNATEVNLGNIVNISSSKRVYYKEYVSSGIPFYRSKEIIELSKGNSISSELFISEQRFNELENKYGVPIEGDILLTSVGTLGKCYQVRKNDKFYFKDGNLTWFSNFTHLSSNIIFYWLKSRVGQNELDMASIGSTQAALTISGLKGISIKIPPPNIVEKLDEILISYNDKIHYNQLQIQKLKSIRDTLLPKLISGEAKVEMN